MIAIKPGNYAHYFVKFTKEMLKDYFKEVRKSLQQQAKIPEKT